MNLSIVVPAHNEEENIGEVVAEIEAALDMPHELIVVNDHSTDRTPFIIEELSRRYQSLRLVHNSNEKGFANAVKFGFSQVKGELVVPVMGDLCDELSTVRKMLARIEEGYDVVCGARYIKGGGRLGGSKVKGFFSSFVGWSLYYLLGIPTHDIANAFKMYRKKVLDAVEIESRGFEISMEIPLKAYYRGFRITEVPTVWKERQKGQSSFKMFELAPNYLRWYIWGIKKRLEGGARCLKK